MVLFYVMWSKFENSKNTFCGVTLENSKKNVVGFCIVLAKKPTEGMAKES